MPVAITAVPDHVAVAVPSIDQAAARWIGQLGGAFMGPTWDGGGGFRTRHVIYANRGKLELLEPADRAGFAQAFLDRFGATVHHVTLKVPRLHDSIAVIERAGYDVVDVDDTSEHWKEGFLRPSQVGGMIVQIAETPYDDEAWARLRDVPRVDTPSAGAPALLGPTLHHPDLDAAARVWSTLGAEVHADATAMTAGWGDAPITVRVEQSDMPGPIGLRFDPDPNLAADGVAGPRTLPAADRPARHGG